MDAQQQLKHALTTYLDVTTTVFPVLVDFQDRCGEHLTATTAKTLLDGLRTGTAAEAKRATRTILAILPNGARNQDIWGTGLGQEMAPYCTEPIFDEQAAQLAGLSLRAVRKLIKDKQIEPVTPAAIMKATGAKA